MRRLPSSSFCLEFPCLSAHGAFRVILLTLSPPFNAVDVEGMSTFPRNNGAILPREAALWAARLELLATNAACVVPTIPHPTGYEVGTLHFYIHRRSLTSLCFSFTAQIYTLIYIYICTFTCTRDLFCQPQVTEIS